MLIHNCEQNSQEWLDLRCSIPTSSGASKLVTSTGKPSESMGDYAAMLAGEAYAGGQIDDFMGNKHTERGHELEAEALAYYSMMHDVDIVQAGFITTDDGKAGSSPDALILTDGLGEVKCLGYKAHIEALMYINKHGKIPTKFVPQVQDQMLVCEREWCDSIFYHPKLPTVIVRNEPIQAVVDGLLSQKEALFIKRDIVLNILNNC